MGFTFDIVSCATRMWLSGCRCGWAPLGDRGAPGGPSLSPPDGSAVDEEPAANANIGTS